MNAPDLTTYHAVHVALRAATHAMANAVATVDPTDRRRTKAIARYWKGYAGEVLIHHTVEDEVVFPELVERVPVAADHIARIDVDHHHLDELMAGITAEVAAVAAGGDPTRGAELLRELAEHMDTHLDFEDADLLPLIERHFTGEEYDALEQRAMKLVGVGRQAAFSIPFVAVWATDEVRAHMLASAPAAFRLLWRATRGSHARLMARAFGATQAVAIPAST